jgi:uncharacterized protein YwqG
MSGRKQQTREELQNLLKPLLKKAAKVILKPQAEIPADTELRSHFGGQPYFEKGETWPKAKNGNNLVFVCQFFNEPNSALPPYIQLVQFYYDFDDLTPWNTDGDGWFAKVYETLDCENKAYIKKPAEYFHRYFDKPEIAEEWNWVNHCEVEYKPVLSLPDWQWIDEVDKNAASIFDKADLEYEDIVEELVGYSDMFSQTGGYPQWIQSGITPKDNFDFLFQIDSESDAGLMWSDCGMVYFFYNRVTKEVIFEKECY